MHCNVRAQLIWKVSQELGSVLEEEKKRENDKKPNKQKRIKKENKNRKRKGKKERKIKEKGVVNSYLHCKENKYCVFLCELA